jgi:hypothetical protein
LKCGKDVPLCSSSTSQHWVSSIPILYRCLLAPLNFSKKKWQFLSLRNISTNNNTNDPPLHTVALYGHLEMTLLLNMHSMNLKSFGKAAW